MRELLTKYKIPTYFGIVGFILGSLGALYCNYEVIGMYEWLPWWHVLIAAALLAFGFFASLFISKRGKPAAETT